MTKTSVQPAPFGPLFWDAAIVLLLLVSGSIALWAHMYLQQGHSSLWLEILRDIFAIGFLLVAYGSFIEPRLLRVRRERIRIAGMGRLRIAVIADLHVGTRITDSFVSHVVDKANTLEADIVLLPGDFVDDGESDIHHLSPLKHLRAKLGVFAVMGNHDSGHFGTLIRGMPFQGKDRTEEVTSYLRSLNITVLRNERVLLTHNGSQFAIAGADHVWMNTADLPATLKNIPPATTTILMAHSPDVILDEESKKADLIVSGHTHGGQIRLPFIGALPPIPDALGRKYDWGLFALENGSQLSITCGIGSSVLRSRLFCWPEIVLMEIEAA